MRGMSAVECNRVVGFVASALLLLACDVLDPVYTHDLCRGNGTISAHCPGCLKPPFSPNCPQCQVDPRPEDCGNANLMTDPGSSGTGGDQQAPAGEGGTDSGGQAAAGVSAPGNAGAGAASGVNGHPIAGAGGLGSPPSGGSGGSKEPFRCVGDSDCGAPTPACLGVQQRCVECVENMHCKVGRRACDPSAHRCVECVTSMDCDSPLVCDMTLQRCVECRKSADCTTNPVLDICTASFKCVDCDLDNAGCSDDPKHPACVAQQCVECDNDANCNLPNLHKCLRTAHKCVECLNSNSDCAAAERPVCKAETQSCVQCLAGTDCPSQHCVAEQCVECEADANCLSASKAACTGNECVPCKTNLQCQHLAATPACYAAAGTCVPCIDDSTCGANSCIRSTHTCGTTKRGSVAACGHCAADTECGANMKCVALGSEMVCAYSRGAGCAGASSASSVSRPFTRTVQASSVDSAPGPFCAPPRSCKAFLDASNPVGGVVCRSPDTVCGLGGTDAICNNSNRCTYTCTNNTDCPTQGLNACTDGQCAGMPQ